MAFLLNVLQNMGCGPTIWSWMHKIHSSQQAKILINVKLREAISIEKGMHQECPLSPLLFILANRDFI